MTIEPTGSGSRVTYEVDFDFKGPAAVVAPLLKPALTRLADNGRDGMERALARL